MTYHEGTLEEAHQLMKEWEEDPNRHADMTNIDVED